MYSFNLIKERNRMLDIIVIAGAAWTCGFIIALSLCYFEVIGPKHCHCKDSCCGCGRHCCGDETEED